MIDKEALKKQYKENPYPMGVYKIENKVNGKIFIGSARNLNARINRHKGELKFGGDNVKPLQEDYIKYGEENFSFEIIDTLKPVEDPEYNYKEDLEVLEQMWLEKLQPYGDKGYNIPGKKYYFKK